MGLSQPQFEKQLLTPDLPPEVGEYINDLRKQLDNYQPRMETLQNKGVANLNNQEIDELTYLNNKASRILGLIRESRDEKRIIKEDDIGKSLDIIKAQETMGAKNFMGPEQIEKAFDTIIPPEEIPEIPFPETELIRAKDLGQMLILRIDHIDGKPLTMELLNNIIQEKLTELEEGKLLDNPNDLISNYSNEDFFKSLNIKLSWALSTKNVLGENTKENKDGDKIEVDKKYDSTFLTYVEQTDILIKYIQEQVFKDQEPPDQYKEAIEKFYEYCDKNKLFQDTEKRILLPQDEIKEIIKNNDKSKGKIWSDFATELKNLSINQLTRRSATEIVYDSAVYFLNTGDYLLGDRYDWGRDQWNALNLAAVGCFYSDGASVSRSAPGTLFEDFGVCLSRHA